MSESSADQKRSKRTSPMTACTGKVGFESFRKASAVLSRNQTKARPGRSSYRCGHCHLWHIGTGGRVEILKTAEFKERKRNEQ